MKIFCLVNGGGDNWLSVIAMCGDGNVLANHVSTNIEFAKHDIGITSDWQHDKYKEHCPDGYELVWIDEDDAVSQMGEKNGELYDAYVKNQVLGKKEKTDE